MAQKMTIRKRCVNPSATNVTTAFIGKNCAIHQISISVVATTTNYTFQLRDRDSPNNFVLINTAITPSSDIKNLGVQNFIEPIPMRNGIEAVTGGGSGGELHIAITLSLRE
jgi:hypothetical protein